MLPPGLHMLPSGLCAFRMARGHYLYCLQEPDSNSLSVLTFGVWLPVSLIGYRGLLKSVYSQPESPIVRISQLALKEGII